MRVSKPVDHRRRRQPMPLLAAILALVLLAASCSSDQPEGAEADQTTGQASGDGEREEAATDDNRTDGEGADDDDTQSEVGTGELAEGAVADPAGLASIEETPCAFDEAVPLPVEPVCHTISVPENWDDPDPEDQVLLQVAVFAGEDSSLDPTIYFDGGPGGHTLDVLAFSFGSLVEPFLGRGDYVLFDQRGVGLSEPALDCPEVTSAGEQATAENPSQDEERDLVGAAYLACRDRLVGAGVDLTAYHSIASANDIEAIKDLLGYERFDVLSISYGTRLAQTYMRLHPDSIRSVVLDSVFPTEANLWSRFTPGAERAFEQLFEGCRQSSSCAEAHPDFEEDYFDLVAQLDETPIDLEVPDLFGGDPIPARYDGTDLVGLTFGALYDRSRFSILPALVDDGLDGDYSAVRQLAAISLANQRFVSTGLQATVECNEEIPFESVDELEANRASDARYEPLDRIDSGLSFFELCDDWPAGSAPDVENELVESEAPTLVLAGRYDPITPPAGADVVIAGLPTSYSLLFPHDGHGLISTDCGAEIVRSFLDEPTTEPESSCIDATAPPAFVPEADATPIEFEPFELTGLVAISGVRPVGWTDVGNGVFARQRTAVDPAVLIVQPTGGLPADSLLDLLGTQLGGSFDPNGTADVDGVAWQLFRSTIPDEQQTIRAAVDDETGVLIVIIGADEEIDELFDQIFEPVATAAEPG